jgi:nitrate/nitrite transporter NarK
MLPSSGWRGAFIILGAASLVWVLIWIFVFRDNPRKHPSITKAEIDDLPPYSAGVKIKHVPWRKLAPRIFPTVMVFFCHAWVLWLYLTWMPTFLQEHSHIDLKKAALFTGLIFLPGTLGDTVGGWLSDWLYRVTGNLNAARRNVVILGFAVSLTSLSAVFFTNDITLVALALAVALFFLEMTEGPVWAVPMDIAPRYSGVAGGFVSSAAGLGALISPAAFGFIAQETGSVVVPFGVSIGFLAMGIVLSFFMRADRPVDDDTPPVQEPAATVAEVAS